MLYKIVSGDKTIVPYTTPITDRSAADIAAKNSRAYLNLADWNRIYGNSSEVNDLFSAIGISITFDEIGALTIAYVFTQTVLNTILANIERMRLWVATNAPGAITDPLFVEIKDDWDEGYLATAPDYTHVNSWEKVLDLMYNAVGTWNLTRKARTGISISGAGLTRNNSWRG